MPNLKDLKNRIESVKSTRKITKAMQMVAAAKLRKAQEAAEQARPYAEKMSIVIKRLASSTNASSNSPLLVGNGKDKTHLIIVATSERGLCGEFNSSIVRLAKNHINQLLGHDDGSIVLDVYSGGLAIEPLLQSVNKLHYNFVIDNILKNITGMSV